MKKFSDLTHNLTEASNLFNEDQMLSINESLLPLMDRKRSKLLSNSLKNPSISLIELEEALDFVLDSSIDFELDITLDTLNEEAFKKDDIEDAINTLPFDVEELKDFKITIDGKNILVNWTAKEGKVAIQIDGKDIKSEGRSFEIESLISSVRQSLEDWSDEETSDDLDSAIDLENDSDKRKKLATLKSIIVPRIISKFANSNSDRNRLIRSLTDYITKGEDEEILTTDVDQRAVIDIFFDILDVITSNKQLASLISRNAVLVSNSYITEAKKKKNVAAGDDDGGVSTKLDILLKLGLVDMKLYTRAKKALSNKKAAGSVPQLRNILFDLLDKLIVYIKKDPTIYNRLRINVMKEMKGTLPSKLEVLEAKNAGTEAAYSGSTDKTVPEQYKKHYFTREAWLEGFTSSSTNDETDLFQKPNQAITGVVESVGLKGNPRKIGKRMGNDLYIHKDYAQQAGVPMDVLRQAQKRLPDGHDFDIVKYNKATGDISFIESPNFNLADEPTVGTAIKVIPDGKLSITKQKSDPQIYHHKWEMVPDNYPGFDVSQSKKRSEAWRSVVGVDKEISSRIGTKSFWDKNVVPKISSDSLKKEKLDERLGMVNYYSFWGIIIGKNVTIGEYMMDKDNKSRFKGRIITPDLKVSSMSKSSIAPGSIYIPNEKDVQDRFGFYHSSLFDGLLAKNQDDIDDIEPSGSYDNVYKSGSLRFYVSNGVLEIESDYNINIDTNILLTGLKAILDIYSKAPAAILKVFPNLVSQLPDTIVIFGANVDIKVRFDLRYSLSYIRNSLMTNEEITYSKTADKVIANLTSHDSAAFTRLANQIKKMQVLEDDIKKIKEDIKTATKQDIQSLFDAEDAIKTRVVETVSFSLVLSKDPKPSETVKYKEVLEELSKNLTPDLIAKLEELKKKYVTVTQKSASLTLKESIFDTLKTFFKSIVSWGNSFDSKLAKLKKKLGVAIKEENMKTYKEFISESLDMTELDSLIDVNDQLTELNTQTFETKEQALETVLGIIAPLGLSFDVAGSVDLESIELTNDAEEGQEAVVEVVDDMEEKIEGELSLNVTFQEVEGGFSIMPELMVAFDEDEQMKMSDVDFEYSDSDYDDEESEEDMYTEEYIEGKTFNVILFKPSSRRVFSVILSADGENELKMQIKNDYPEYEIHHILPITINDYNV